MSKPVIHVTAEEAASDFASLLARVRAGTEVVIEDSAAPVAVVRPAEAKLRTLSEAIAILEKKGSDVTLDGEFGKDLEAVINSHREPMNPPEWD